MKILDTYTIIPIDEQTAELHLAGESEFYGTYEECVQVAFETAEDNNIGKK